MRFVAPVRAAVAAERFEHPVFAAYAAHVDLLAGPTWPGIDTLNERMAAFDPHIRFAVQDAALLADGEHYETRIARHHRVATRVDNWHDLLNALVWMRYPQLKRALNTRQVADIAVVGPRQRTRGQCALTHFDEAGIVVVVPDDTVVRAWDQHDWQTLFVHHQREWRERIGVHVFGHALLEHALYPWPWLVGKALVVRGDPTADGLTALAGAIARGALLSDPQHLRPLPLAGLPDWHPRAGEPAFYREAPCFQPVRAGRVYPAPWPTD